MNIWYNLMQAVRRIVASSRGLYKRCNHRTWRVKYEKGVYLMKYKEGMIKIIMFKSLNSRHVTGILIHINLI
jgi:hypothetical protein